MTTSVVATAPVGQLAAGLRGDLILPADPGYDQARAVYNAMIDKRPAAIVRCRDAADVVACVRFCRANDIEIAVRGGGHNAAGLGVWDDALVIDLSMMRSTTVSPQDHTVRVDGGCTWADVDHATVAFGMATPSGVLSSTGVGGLTLGGGIGYLARRFGLTVDNLLAADVVLADGTLVTASSASHPDLVWARPNSQPQFTYFCVLPPWPHGPVISLSVAGSLSKPVVLPACHDCRTWRARSSADGLDCVPRNTKGSSVPDINPACCAYRSGLIAGGPDRTKSRLGERTQTRYLPTFRPVRGTVRLEGAASCGARSL